MKAQLWIDRNEELHLTLGEEYDRAGNRLPPVGAVGWRLLGQVELSVSPAEVAGRAEEPS